MVSDLEQWYWLKTFSDKLHFHLISRKNFGLTFNFNARPYLSRVWCGTKVKSKSQLQTFSITSLSNLAYYGTSYIVFIPLGKNDVSTLRGIELL